MNWIDINTEKPSWYTNVDIKVNGVIKENRHRLSDDENIYYGSLDTNEIIYEKEVSHWKLK